VSPSLFQIILIPKIKSASPKSFISKFEDKKSLVLPKYQPKSGGDLG
jgi:hypothetical protein